MWSPKNIQRQPFLVKTRIQRLREIEDAKTPVFLSKSEYDTLPTYLTRCLDWAVVRNPTDVSPQFIVYIGFPIPTPRSGRSVS